MARYELHSESTVYSFDGERKEALAIATFIANTNREVVWFGATHRNQPHEYVTPRNTTFREFIHAVRRALDYDHHCYSYEVWFRDAYKGERNVYGAIGYLRMMKAGTT